VLRKLFISLVTTALPCLILIVVCTCIFANEMPHTATHVRQSLLMQ